MYVDGLTPESKAVFSTSGGDAPITAESLVADSAFSDRPFFSIFDSKVQGSMKQEAYGLLMAKTKAAGAWPTDMIGEMYQLVSMDHKPFMAAFEKFSGGKPMDVWLGDVKIKREFAFARVVLGGS